MMLAVGILLGAILCLVFLYMAGRMFAAGFLQSCSEFLNNVWDQEKENTHATTTRETKGEPGKGEAESPRAETIGRGPEHTDAP